MSEDLKLQIAVLIKNCITLICFSVIAIIFNKWWIVLFTAIFLTSVTEKNKKEEK